jgi:hypothetical protein
VVLVAIAVVGIAVFGLLSYRNREQAKGTELLAQATVVLNTAVVPVNAETKPGDAPAAAGIGAKGTFSTETQKLNAAVPKLRAAADAYPDTDGRYSGSLSSRGIAGCSRPAERGD